MNGPAHTGTCALHAEDPTRSGRGASEEEVMSAWEWAMSRSPTELLDLYQDDLSFLRRFVIGAALSERGLPPSDRPVLPPSDRPVIANFKDDCAYCVSSLAAADVVWLATRYPDHEPRDARLREIFDMRAAPLSIALIAHHSADAVVAELALTEEQLTECVFFPLLACDSSDSVCCVAPTESGETWP
jgi:hypothetical protein